MQPNFALRLARRLHLAQWSPWPLVAAGLLIIGLGLGLDLRRQYHEAEAHEHERLVAAANAVAHGVGQRLVAAAMLLARLDDALEANPADADAIVQAVSGLESHLIAVLVVDADGRIAASSRAELVGIDLSSDELVWSARADADVDPRLYLRTPAATLAASGRLAARARRSSDGGYAGITAAIVAPAFFEATLVPLGGSGAAIEIVDGDGAIALRWPVAAGADGVADPDTERTLLAETVVSSTLVALDRPWSVRVSRSEAAVFSTWSRQARFGVLLWLLVAVVAIIAGVIGALRRTEVNRLRGLHQRLLQGVDEGLAGIDLDARVRFANAAFARYLQTTPGDLLGRDLRDRSGRRGGRRRVVALRGAVRTRPEPAARHHYGDTRGRRGVRGAARLC
jgi:PAS domain-containing protein